MRLPHVKSQLSLLLALAALMLAGMTSGASAQFALKEKLLQFSPQPERFALLIGIDNYLSQADKPFTSCVNDVNDMSELLVDKFSFPSHHITILRNHEATKESILSNFKSQLIENAKKHPDAIIIFQFSGRGSRGQRSEQTLSSEEAMLLAADSSVASGTQIRNQEIVELLGDLAKYTANIALIIDAPYFSTLMPERIESEGKTLPLIGSFVLLTAARHTELAYESAFKTEKGIKHNGIFTHSLLQALRRIGPATRYREIFDDVTSAVTAKIAVQHPQIEGDWWRRIFGGTAKDAARESFIKIRSVNGRSLVIAAGSADGVQKGALCAIYAPDARQLTGEEKKLATAVVTSVQASTSVVRLSQAKSIPLEAKIALVQPSYAIKRLRVALNLTDVETSVEDSELSRNIAEQLKHSKLAEIVKGGAKNGGPEWLQRSGSAPLWDVAINRRKFGEVFKAASAELAIGMKNLPDAQTEVYYLSAPDGMPLLNFFVRTTDQSGAASIVQMIENLAKQQGLKVLYNKESQFRDRVKITFCPHSIQ